MDYNFKTRNNDLMRIHANMVEALLSEDFSDIYIIKEISYTIQSGT